MSGTDLLASVLNGGNEAYLADLYARWVKDPASVDSSFATIFEALDDDAAAVLKDSAGASWAPRASVFAPAATQPALGPSGTRAVQDSLAICRLIRAFREYGHLEARTDPLGLSVPAPAEELNPETYGFTEADLSRSVFFGNELTDLFPGRTDAPVREIIAALRRIYCGTTGAEYLHLRSAEERDWFRHQIETQAQRRAITDEDRKAVLRHLTEAEAFEGFCQKRFVGAKRFGLEGAEVSMAALHAVIDQAARQGVRSVAIAMAHRGRLATLVSVVRKPFAAMFREFAGGSFKPDSVAGSGDVKYHLGASADIETSGHTVHVSLQPNPSHLEAVDPVVCGRIRAAQDDEGDAPDRRAHMAVQIHGDAAFAGQGVVYETLSLSRLEGYRTGGSVHLIVNNQIGFTTDPSDGHSGVYGSDMAKAIEAPVLHVSGDDPEAVVAAARLLTDYRQKFGGDAVMDLICYRRNGHNELDEPTFTQPLMYKAVAAHRSPLDLYVATLVSAGVITQKQADEELKSCEQTLEDAFLASKTFQPEKAGWLEGHWSSLSAPPEGDELQPETGVPLAVLKETGKALVSVPEGFDLNPKIARQMRAKEKAISEGAGIDWATAEALAFGTVLLDGHRVRLSGEDVRRGTFSQRHAVLYDQTTQKTFVPLNHISGEQKKIDIWNSNLSEFAVLGFEYGYTMYNPQTLVLWEAQFGDFANGAQVIIDQFIAAGQTKWLRMSGLVMLLPHGYEGQGPEHSSARPERYLQLCAENNLFVCNLTTPANYFHALRRQLALPYRRPLILMEPKSLLRHRLAVSDLSDMESGQKFFPVIGNDNGSEADAVRRIILCSGKIYYDLLSRKESGQSHDCALIRLEQLYPFPRKELEAEIRKYPGAEKVIWCQEEIRNGGAWSFVQPLIADLLQNMQHRSSDVLYAGRVPAASPATGLHAVHMDEQEAVVSAAFTL